MRFWRPRFRGARVDDLSMTALIKTTSTIITVTTIVKTIG